MARLPRAWRFATPQLAMRQVSDRVARRATEQQESRREALSIGGISNVNNARLHTARSAQLRAQQLQFIQQRENGRSREAMVNQERMRQISVNSRLAAAANNEAARLSVQPDYPAGQPYTLDRQLREITAAEYALPPGQRIGSDAYYQRILATQPTNLAQYGPQEDGGDPRWRDIPLLSGFFRKPESEGGVGESSIFDMPVFGGLFATSGFFWDKTGSLLEFTGDFMERDQNLARLKRATGEPLLKGLMSVLLWLQENGAEPIGGLLTAPSPRGDYRSVPLFYFDDPDPETGEPGYGVGMRNWMDNLFDGTGEYSGLYQDEVDAGPLGNFWNNFRAAWGRGGELWRESNEPFAGYKGGIEILTDPLSWLWTPASAALKAGSKAGLVRLVKYADNADPSVLNAPLRTAIKGIDTFGTHFSNEYRWWRVGAPKMHEMLRRYQAEHRAIPRRVFDMVEQAIGSNRRTGGVTGQRGISEFQDYFLSDAARAESHMHDLLERYPEMVPQEVLDDAAKLESIGFEDLSDADMRKVLEWHRDEWRPGAEREKIAAGFNPDFKIDDYLHRYWGHHLDDALAYTPPSAMKEGKLGSAYRRSSQVPEEGMVPSFLYSIIRDRIETRLFALRKNFIADVVGEWGIHPETLQPVKGGKRFAGQREFVTELKRLQTELGDVMPQVAEVNSDILMARGQMIRAGMTPEVADEFIEKVLMPSAQWAVTLDPQRFPTIADYTRELPTWIKGSDEMAQALQSGPDPDVLFEWMDDIQVPTSPDMAELKRIVDDGLGKRGAGWRAWYENAGGSYQILMPDEHHARFFSKVAAALSPRTQLRANVQEALAVTFNIRAGRPWNTNLRVPNWGGKWAREGGKQPVINNLRSRRPNVERVLLAFGVDPQNPARKLLVPNRRPFDKRLLEKTGEKKLIADTGVMTDELGALQGNKVVSYDINKVEGMTGQTGRLDALMGIAPLTIDGHMFNFYGQGGTTSFEYFGSVKRTQDVADEFGLAGTDIQGLLWGEQLERAGRGGSQSVTMTMSEMIEIDSDAIRRMWGGDAFDPFLKETVDKRIRGAIRFAAEEGNAQPMVYLFETADFRTLVHEQGHFIRRFLPKPHYDAVAEVYTQGGKWTREAEEAFASDFTDFVVSSRVADHPKFRWGIRDAFHQVKTILKAIYNDMVGKTLGNTRPMPARHIFEEWFSNAGPTVDAASATRQFNPQVVVAPAEGATQKATKFGDADSLKGEFDQAVQAHADTVGGSDKILGVQVNRGAWFNPETQKLQPEFSTIIDLAPDVPMENVYDFADQVGRSQKQWETWVVGPEADAAKIGVHAETWFDIKLGGQVSSKEAGAYLKILEVLGGGATVTPDGRILLMNSAPYQVTRQGTLAYNQASTWLKRTADDIDGLLRNAGHSGATITPRRGHIRRLNTGGTGTQPATVGGAYPRGQATPVVGSETFDIPTRSAGGAGVEAEVTEALRGVRPDGGGAGAAAVDPSVAAGSRSATGGSLSDLPRRRPRVPTTDDIERYQDLKGGYSGTPEQIWDQRVAANDLPELPLTYGKQKRPPPGYAEYYPKGPVGFYPIAGGTELVEAEARALAKGPGVASVTLDPGAKGIETTLQRTKGGLGIKKNEMYWLPEEIKKALEMGDDPLKQFRVFRGYDKGAAYMKLLFTRFFTDYHARNFWSGYHNMVLDGVWNPQYIFKAGHVLMSYMFPDAKWAAKTVNRVPIDDYLHSLRADGVLGTGQVSGEIDELLGGITSELGMPKAKGGKLGRALEFSQTAAEFIENIPRVAHHLGLTAQKVPFRQAGKRVRRLQVDYNDLTPFEKMGPRRLAFFYTYARKMGPVMAHEMLKGRKLAGVNMGPTAMVYSRTTRGLQNLFDPTGEDTRKEAGLANAWLWDRFSFAMGRTPDGNPKILYATGLPVELINNFWMGNAGRTFDMWKSQVQPLLKAPFEAPIQALWDPDTAGKTVSPNYSTFTHRTVDDPSYQNWFRRGAPFINKIPGLRDWLQMEETEIPIKDTGTGAATGEMRSIFNVNPHRMYLFMSVIGRFVNTAQEGVEAVQGVMGDDSIQQQQKSMPERILQLISGAKFATIDLQRRQTIGFGVEHTAAYDGYGSTYEEMARWWSAGQMPDGTPYTGAMMMEARADIKEELAQDLAVADNNLVKAGHLSREEVADREFLRISLLSGEDRKLAELDNLNPDNFRLGDGSVNWDGYWLEFDQRYEALSPEQKALLDARKEETIMRLPEGARPMERLIQQAFDVSRQIADVPGWVTAAGGAVNPAMAEQLDEADRYIRGLARGLGEGAMEFARQEYIRNSAYPGTPGEKMRMVDMLRQVERNPLRAQLRVHHAALLKAVFGDVPMDVLGSQPVQRQIATAQQRSLGGGRLAVVPGG